MRPGWTGVDLFFVISGFLISGLLFEEFQQRGQINFGRFAIRRALKLYPALYVLVFGVMVVHLIHPGSQSVSDILTPLVHDLLFLQSYFPGTYGHFWSLSVEEHFYVLLPLTLYFMLRRARAQDADPFRRLPMAFLFVAVFCFSVRLVHALMVQPYECLTHLFHTHLRLDSLLFGVVLSYWRRFRPERFQSIAGRFGRFLLPVSLVFVSAGFVWEQSDFFMYTAGLTILYLGYGGLLIGLLEIPETKESPFGWLLKACSYVGQHSYSIYLFHIPVMAQLRRAGLLHGWPGMAVYFVSSLVIGILLSKLIEFPVLNLRDRFFPRQAGAGLPDRAEPSRSSVAA